MVGCGGDDEAATSTTTTTSAATGATGPTSEQTTTTSPDGAADQGSGADAEAAVQAFIDGFAEGDPQKACSLLTEAGARSFEEDAGGTCEAQIQGASPEELEAIGNAKTEVLDASEDEATVKASISGDTPTVLELVLDGDEWKIDAVR